MFRKRRRERDDAPEDGGADLGSAQDAGAGEQGEEQAEEQDRAPAARAPAGRAPVGGEAMAGGGAMAGGEALAGGPDEAPDGLSPRPDGPWDAGEVPDTEVERFDLGGLQLAIPDGAQVQLDVTPDNQVLPTVFLGESAVQISAFAAPRRSGIWAEVRTEIAESLREAGGEVVEQAGPFGVELHGSVPVQLPDGAIALQPARFVGIDGPRWFLRGLFTGEAVDPAAAGPLEEAFRGTVVVRGTDAMAPRDPLPVIVPPEILEAAGIVPEDGDQDPGQEPPGLEPFSRGPEITEVR